MNLSAWCPQCGPNVAYDEDGCCNYCGATAKGDGAMMAHAFRDALFWCSGSPDFAEGGKAREGWLRLCAPLLKPGTTWEEIVAWLRGGVADTEEP